MTAIIFDIDGTLTNTTKVDDKCFIQAFQHIFGIDISNQNWSDLQNVTDWGITEEIVFKEMNRIPTDSEYKKMILEFVRLLTNELKNNKMQFKEIEGALNFIQSLKQSQNFSIGIATGGWEKTAILKLKSIGIDYTEFAFSNSNQFMKRGTILVDTIQQLRKKLDKKIERTIFFGDGIWDFLTCKELGIEFIGIDNQHNGELKKIGAKTVFNDFKNPELIINYINNRVNESHKT